MNEPSAPDSRPQPVETVARAFRLPSGEVIRRDAESIFGFTRYHWRSSPPVGETQRWDPEAEAHYS